MSERENHSGIDVRKWARIAIAAITFYGGARICEETTRRALEELNNRRPIVGLYNPDEQRRLAEEILGSTPTEEPLADSPEQDRPINEGSHSNPSAPPAMEPTAMPTVEPTAMPTVEPTAMPIVEPTATEAVPNTSSFSEGWDISWYQSPFRGITDKLADSATYQTFAEPGVLLDNTAAFDYLTAQETPIVVPEGGYSYISTGAITIEYDGIQLELPHQEGNNYLIIVRGLPDDGTNTDRNRTIITKDYVRGAGIYANMRAGAYVSLGWMEQQIVNSGADPNCGGSGCTKATIVVVDLQTQSYRSWEVENPTNEPRNWQRVE